MKQVIHLLFLIWMLLLAACSPERGPLIVDDPGLTHAHLTEANSVDTLDYQYADAAYDTAFNHNGLEIEIHLTRRLSEDSTRVLQTIKREGEIIHARCFENRVNLELLRSEGSSFTQQIEKRDLLPTIQPWLDEAQVQFFMEQAILVNVHFRHAERSGSYLFTSSFQIGGTLLPDLISLRIYPDCCMILIPRKQAAHLIRERYEQTLQDHARL